MSPSNNDAAILSLPPDVVCHIMWIISGGWVSIDPRADIWPITKVCKQWRSIALDFRHMWSRVLIDEGTSLIPCTVDILKECLARSSGSPLHLQLHLDRLLAHAEILDALITHSNRWCTLRLGISLFLLKSLNTQIRGRGFPLLKRLDLTLLGNHIEIADLTAFQNCPEVEDVTLDSIPRGLALNLSWSHLRRLAILERMHGDFLFVLEKAVNLTCCALVSLIPRTTPQSYTKVQPILRPSIRALAVHSTIDLKVLDHLVLPNLDTAFFFGNIAPSYSSLSSFLARSSCRLTRLMLRGVLFDDVALGRMLEGTPTIEHLDLGDWVPHQPCFNFDSLVEKLIDDTCSPVLLPQLKTLVFINDSNAIRRTRTTVSAPLLVAMVESRWNSPRNSARIQSITLHGRMLFIENRSALDKLREPAYAGFVLKVISQHAVFDFDVRNWEPWSLS